MITKKFPTTWKGLQEDVVALLKECGFSVESPKVIQTPRGEVEVDVYAEEIINDRKYIIVCECKYWKKRVPKTVIHSFRTVISETGANIGYVISTKGFQSGAVIASKSTNLCLLDWEEFQNSFEKTWVRKYFMPIITDKLAIVMTYAEPILPKWFYELDESKQKEFMELKKKYDIFGVALMMVFSTYTNILSEDYPKLPLSNRLKEGAEKYVKFIPTKILNGNSYREFLESAISFGKKIVKEFKKISDLDP